MKKKKKLDYGPVLVIDGEDRGRFGLYEGDKIGIISGMIYAVVYLYGKTIYTLIPSEDLISFDCPDEAKLLDNSIRISIDRCN